MNRDENERNSNEKVRNERKTEKYTETGEEVQCFIVIPNGN